MKYRYYICDVFTERRFGGNPLAVLPKADGLSDHQMQQITREFNFSESAFVFPAKAGNTRHVRIFTPAGEIPFAGHPNVGTAFVLASAGEFGEINSSLTVTFEEEAGLVPIAIRAEEGRDCVLRISGPAVVLSRENCCRPVGGVRRLARPRGHRDGYASSANLFGRSSFRDNGTARSHCPRTRPNQYERVRCASRIWESDPQLHLYIRVSDDFDIRARMFAPLSGVPEDPATGSASCALAGLLAHYKEEPSGSFSWRIAQGVEMGRPSTSWLAPKRRTAPFKQRGSGARASW